MRLGDPGVCQGLLTLAPPAVLPWNVRLALWVGIAAFATVGLYAGDYFYPVEEDELERALEAEKARMASSSRAGS